MTVAATQNTAPVVPTFGTSQTNSSGSASTTGTSTGSNVLNFTSNFNTFLTLLTTQLQNQDPLSPMDTNTFTQQLVEFSQVEQQINTNNNLQSLISLQTAGETIASTPLVGDQIQYNSATAPLQDGSATYSYTLPTASTQTALVVTDANGNQVYTTTGSTSAGTSSFTWNGENNAGQQMPDGAYTLQVIATGANNSAIQATVNSIGTISSVSVNNGAATFDVDGISVPMSELVTVNPKASSSTSSN
ncbi:MAG TPA: flagellar hook capping FlgD N-terminal domain-containing protein [Stellaceae bacterium]|nr:flagellar hook capping FlgD N-terminal domain-containing protein [Stellaceae bacterium]